LEIKEVELLGKVMVLDLHGKGEKKWLEKIRTVGEVLLVFVD
jgi:hypothetical protein